MEELSSILSIKNIRKIEAFDNSNLFGSFSVSGMVTFIDGKPSKKDYRKYKISLDKNDDYNMMREVIYRRYFKVLKDKLERPDIIIVDGGVGQINAARETLEDLNMNIPVFGLAKNDKHKTSELLGFTPIRKIEINRNTNVFHLLNRIQDEVHRWTINYHKNIRSKGNLSSLLDNVEGIGPKRKKELLKKYKSLKRMKEISLKELQETLPAKTAENLYNFLKEHKK
jgi:excinuclease ABC subunit C